MTQDDLAKLRAEGFTFSQIGEYFGLTERQVNYRVKKWGLNFSNKKSLNENFFSSNTKSANYWAGFLAADGWIESARSRVGLALQAQDLNHLEKFKKAVGSSHNICPFMSNTAYRIRFNSETMVEDLNSRFNITPQKTHTYKMPFFEENYLLLEFLRGYIEGDGHLDKKASGRVSLSLCSANSLFLEEFKEICEVLLDKSIDQKIVLNTNPKGRVFNITLNLDDSEKMINLLYKNSTEATRLDRKFKIASLVLR